MGEHAIRKAGDEAEGRAFTRAVLNDIRALEALIEDGRIETGVKRVGVEQEMYLVDDDGRPAPVAEKVLSRVGNDQLTTELARFNLEANFGPQMFHGAFLERMENDLNKTLAAVEAAAQEFGAHVLLTGILPTLRQADLSDENLTPELRYKYLNEALFRCRDSITVKIDGIDQYEGNFNSVILEGANTSFQLHLQVEPAEAVDCYNLMQLVTAPLLAAAVNSPVLLGKRLWHETRIAVFERSLDERSGAKMARGHPTRVWFGDKWLEGSIVELFRDNAARFPAILIRDLEEDSLARVGEGGVPELAALALHNGTVWRWNRPCYGVKNGVAHLRIENRVLPSGPTILDEVSNAAFYFGLMSGLANEYDDIAHVMPFDHAKENFHAAARHGLRAQFTWVDGNVVGAPELILEQLLPRARAGLSSVGIDAADIDRYLGCIEARVERRMTGARWSLESAAAMGGKATKDQIARTLVRTAIANQLAERPLHEWEFARPEDGGDWRHSYLKVGQFMTTDLFTVHPEDVVDLAASLMDWRHIRHVPVEDSEGQLVGLVSHRSLLRLVGQGLSGDKDRAISVKDIMKRDPVFVTPDTPTLEAIETMREHRVGSLPVVDKGRLVGIITERDLITVASVLFERHLRESSQE
ncbi:MAG: CBS domain-containing protein [Planctomycetes bacterium]|nr:CBS domain-containing protein [Planctomycetota bacterium]